VRHRVELVRRDAGALEAPARRLLGELPRRERHRWLAVLPATEPLLFRGGDDLAVDDDRGRGVVEHGVHPEHRRHEPSSITRCGVRRLPPRSGSTNRHTVHTSNRARRAGSGVARTPAAGYARDVVGDRRPLEPERVVVVGASAGGIEPLRRVVAGVPAELPVAFIVALHLRADSFSALRRPRPRHQLPVGHAVDGEPLRGGQVYVRPPDVDVIVRSAELHLVHGPTGNGHRPAIGPLFRSAAQAYGERAIGVVVSGVLDDGTAGLAMVKHAGGVAIVQSPTDAVYAAMPRNAMRRVDVDLVVPSGDIGPPGRASRRRGFTAGGGAGRGGT